VSAVETLFAPLALPLASARALLPLHSKMNHACTSRPGTSVSSAATVAVAAATLSAAAAATGCANARVENATERSDVGWSAASERRAQQRATQQGAGTATTTAAAASKANNAKRQKQSKVRRAAEEAAAAHQLRSLQQDEDAQWSRDGQLIESMLQRSSAPNAPAAVSYVATQASSSSSVATAPPAALPTAAVAVPDSAICAIVVRATRDLRAGEEVRARRTQGAVQEGAREAEPAHTRAGLCVVPQVLIDYLPPAVSRADTATRRTYLQSHYLFHCACAACTQESL